MERITSKLSKLDLSTVSKLFPNYDASLLQRPSSEVDVLIGTDYFSLHPKNEVCSVDNLSIMVGELGICLQGSHPMLKVEDEISSNLAMMREAYVYHTEVHHPIPSSVHHCKLPVLIKIDCPPLKLTHSSKEKK